MVLRRFILVFLAVFLISQIGTFAQESPSVVDEKLLKSIQNEVSGERAWDMVSKISRYHRIL